MRKYLKYRKCVKCGAGPSEGVTLHRFPRFPCVGKTVGIDRACIWAKVCYPNEDYHSTDFLKKLRVSGKYLCSKHFRPSFITTKGLASVAFPEEDEELIAYRNVPNGLIEESHQKTPNKMIEAKITRYRVKGLNQKKKKKKMIEESHPKATNKLIEESHQKTPNKMIEAKITRYRVEGLNKKKKKKKMIEESHPKAANNLIEESCPKTQLIVMEQDRCCVPCCFEDRQPLHPFPDNFKLFEEWRKRVKNPSISYSSRYLRTSKVCDAHFSEADRNPEDPTQLLEHSIPTVCVPDFYGDMAAIKQFSSISESTSSSCALCSCLNNHLIPIFGKEGKKNDLATKIHKYLPTTVVDEDLICFSCTTTLMAFHNLFKNCRNVTEVISQDQDTLPRDNGRVCAETQEGNNVSEPSPAKTKKSTTNKEKSYVEKDLEENDENLETNKATNRVGKTSEPSCRTINKCPYNWKELKTILINNSLRFYTCHLCGVCLPNVKNLQEHYKDCSQNVCSRCLKVVGRADILEDHMKICRKYACYMCPDKDMVKYTVYKHLTKIHPVSACELCHHTFLNDMEYEQHRLDTHKFLCERCNNYFESRIEDEQYRRTILPLERLLCLTCYGEYHQIPKIREVGIARKLVNIDTDEANEDVTKFFCITCRNTFDREVDLTSHECVSKNDLGLKIDHRYVKVEDILSCPHCAKIFASHLLLRAHISRSHPGEPDFTCLICTIVFHSESELQNHQRIHSASESETISLRSHGCLPLQSYGDESFTCKYCSKECKAISRLGRHVYAHHRPKKWLCCTICGVLVLQHKMYLHFIRKHPKSYKCRLCSEVFETHAEYTLHRKVGHPRIVCSNCSTRFKRQKELNRHLKKCQTPSNELCQLEIQEQTIIE